MKTISSLSTKIANLEITKEEMEVKLDTLNSQYEGIRNRRTPEVMEEKRINRAAAAELRTKIKNANCELRDLEWDLENLKLNTVAISLWVVLGITAIVGMILLTVYKYKLGLFGLTDTHDLVAIIHGENPVMDITLYKNLFWMHFAGCWSVIVGIFGSLTVSIWYAVKKS